MDKDSEDNFDLDKSLNNLMKAKPTIEFFYIKITSYFCNEFKFV